MRRRLGAVLPIGASILAAGVDPAPRRFMGSNWPKGSATMRAVATIVGCSDDDTRGAQVVTLSEWVVEFEQSCAEVGAQLSAPGLTDEQRTEINERAIAELRSMVQPDELADTAEGLLNDLEESQQPGLDEDTINELECSCDHRDRGSWCIGRVRWRVAG